MYGRPGRAGLVPECRISVSCGCGATGWPGGRRTGKVLCSAERGAREGKLRRVPEGLPRRPAGVGGRSWRWRNVGGAGGSEGPRRLGCQVSQEAGRGGRDARQALRKGRQRQGLGAGGDLEVWGDGAESSGG